MPRPSRRALVVLDAVVALALVAFSLYALSQPWDDGFRAHAGVLDVVAVTALVLPFALRTLAPTLALALALGSNAVAGLVGPHTVLFWSGFLPVLVLVYAVARHDDGWPGRLAFLAGPLALLGNLREADMRALSDLVFTTVLMGAAWGAGRVTRRMAQQGEELDVALARLQLERAAGERQAVEAERGLIAAEVHDVVGHALSLMVLQTGAARLELGVQGGGDAVTAAQGQLRAAEETGRAALEELRSTLGALRGGVPLQVEVDTSLR